jgi:ATP-binding cassette subfamily B protein
MSFPFVKQPDAMDCGPSCLKMIAGFYKVGFSLESLRKKCYVTRARFCVPCQEILEKNDQ